MEKSCETCEYMDDRKDVAPCAICIHNKNYISHYKMHKALKASRTIRTEIENDSKN